MAKILEKIKMILKDLDDMQLDEKILCIPEIPYEPNMK